MLTWTAYERLDLEELTDILSLDEVEGQLDPEARPDPEDIFRFCGSLIRPVGGEIPSAELAHFTVRKFLECIGTDDVHLNKFRLGPSDRLSIVKAKVKYLCASSFNRGLPPTIDDMLSFDNEHPFHQVATRVFRVYNEEKDMESDDELSYQLQKLFDPCKTLNFTNFMLGYFLDFQRTPPDSDQALILQSRPDYPGLLEIAYRLLPIHGAAIFCLHRTCTWLIGEGCDVNRDSPLGTPLECALFGPDVFRGYKFATSESQSPPEKVQDTVSLLLENGATCNHTTTRNFSFSYMVVRDLWMGLECPFAQFIKHGMRLEADVLPLLKLLSESSDPKSAERVLSPIKESGNIEIAPELRIPLLELSRSFDIGMNIELQLPADTIDNGFLHALSFAVIAGQLRRFQELSADPQFKVDIAQVNGSGTLLHLAASCNAHEIFEFLLDLDYDPDRANENGDTVWHTAAASGNRHALKTLLARYQKEKPGLRRESIAHYTPLLSAITNEKEDCARILLDNLHTDSVVLRDWRTLHYAVAHGLFEFVVSLLDYGFDIKSVSDRGQTALFFVASKTSPEIVDLLLRRGLCPDTCDFTGKNALNAFLAHRQRSEDLFDAGVLSKSNVIQIEMRVLEQLATSSSVSAKDHFGNGSWYYFCTEMVPYVLDSVVTDKTQYLTGLLSMLERYYALDIFEERTSKSGVALLVGRYLDWDAREKPSSKRKKEKLRFRLNCLKAMESLIIKTCATPTKKDLDINDPQLIRLLIWSCEEGQLQLIDTLLDLGIDVHATSQYYAGLSAIDYCCVEDTSDASILLKLMKNADMKRFSELNFEGSPSFHKLCLKRSSVELNSNAMVKLEAILKRGADPNATDTSTQETAVHIAACSGFLDCVKLLDQFHANLHQATAGGLGIVPFALRSENESLLRYLQSRLRNKFEWTRRFAIFQKDFHSLSETMYIGVNALHLAASVGNPALLDVLWHTGFFEDIDVPTSEGFTPLYFSICQGRLDAVKWFINHDTKLNAPIGQSNQSALDVAMAGGDENVVLMLVQAGAEFKQESSSISLGMATNSNIRDKLLPPPSDSGVEIPQALLKELKQIRKSHSTQKLFDAIKSDNLKACRAIIAAGKALASPFEECGKCTPLILAVAGGNPQIVDLLLEHGATTLGDACSDVSEENMWLDTALNMAVKNPSLNSVLGKLLNSCLNESDHWIYGLISPLHVAAAFNSEALDIIFSHFQDNRDLLRRVNSVLFPFPLN